MLQNVSNSGVGSGNGDVGGCGGCGGGGCGVGGDGVGDDVGDGDGGGIKVTTGILQTRSECK